MEKVVKQYLKYRKIVRLYCDECDIEMEQKPVVLATNPPMYQYTCPICCDAKATTTQYPFIKEVWVNEDEFKQPVMD